MSRPLIAILRGLEPSEASAMAEALIDAGFDRIEVPLNSPRPFDSIGKMVKSHGKQAVIGAGTVLTTEDAARVAEVGGQIVLSPNMDVDVIKETVQLGMQSYPGVLTPTECFAALHAGATGLKVFPSFQMGTEGLKALRAVLPYETKIYMVGGVGPDNFGDWLAAGASGFGIGSALYKPGRLVEDVAARAREIVAAFNGAAQ